MLVPASVTVPLIVRLGAASASAAASVTTLPAGSLASGSAVLCGRGRRVAAVRPPHPAIARQLTQAAAAAASRRLPSRPGSLPLSVVDGGRTSHAELGAV